jgi:ribonuclease HII
MSSSDFRKLKTENRMTWIIGIDEAGYGPNLGPFVMTSVACRVPDTCSDANLWSLLHPAVRRSEDADEGQLLIDDSKRVYTVHGLAGLERGVLATLTADLRPRPPGTLAALIAWSCPDDGAELRREIWYRGVQPLPIHLVSIDLDPWAVRFQDACMAANVEGWHVRSVVICPGRFNALLDEGGTKGHVLAHALAYLLRWQRSNLSGGDELAFFIDKHGGRNTYAAMIHHALSDGIVCAEQESMACSSYRIDGLERGVRLTFQPRADCEHFCVALASMASKYLREVLMLEFNRFWQEHVPDLKPTAGYPGDAVRFLQAIRQTIVKLGLREDTLWRRK